MSSNFANRGARCVRQLSALAVLFALGACGGADLRGNYTPPGARSIPSSVTVDQPFDQAWEGFVRRLSQGFFQVNNISKESRLINVSIRGRRLREYIDCGKMDIEINAKPWSYRLAESSFHRTGSGAYASITEYRHRVRGYLGRMNIFVAPKGSRTVFEVNTSYALAMSSSGYTATTNLLGQEKFVSRLPASEAEFQLTTRDPDVQFMGNREITCQATGIWEQLVLDLAKGKITPGGISN